MENKPLNIAVRPWQIPCLPKILLTKEKDATTSPVKHPRQMLTTSELKLLSQQSNAAGLMQLTGHLAVLGVSGYLWLAPWLNIGLRLLALVVYGFSLATTFAPRA